MRSTNMRRPFWEPGALASQPHRKQRVDVLRRVADPLGHQLRAVDQLQRLAGLEADL